MTQSTCLKGISGHFVLSVAPQIRVKFCKQQRLISSVQVSVVDNAGEERGTGAL